MDNFWIYFDVGLKHILDFHGYDHILFVAALCGIYLLKDWRQVLILVTAFTIGHSVTLALSVFNVISIRSSLIELLIPVTILITAFTHIVSNKMNQASGWMTYGYAVFFGLIHGMGFSNYLKSLLGASEHIAVPLLAFNIGLEIGQIFIVLTVLTIAYIVNTIFQVSRRDWNLFLSSAIFGIALIMTFERL